MENKPKLVICADPHGWSHLILLEEAHELTLYRLNILNEQASPIDEAPNHGFR